MSVLRAVTTLETLAFTLALGSLRFLPPHKMIAPHHFVFRVHILSCNIKKHSSFSLYLNIQAIEYVVGDILEVLPGQNSAAVDAFIQRCSLDPDALITVSSFLVS